MALTSLKAGARFGHGMRELAGLRVSFLAGSLGQGGAERQLYYMLEVLRNAGATPRVLSLTHGEHWQERIESLGVPVHWVGQSSLSPVRLARIVQELRRNPADVLQSQHFFANNYVIGAARILGLREIGAIRGDGFEELESNPGLLGWLGLRLPRVLAVNSTAAIENAVMLGATRARLFFLPNVVDTEAFTVASREPGKLVKLLTAGSLVPIKRLDRFVRAISAVAKRTRSDVQGLIVGDGPLRAQLESQGKELGLTPEQLRFCGSASNIGSWYRKADAFILTSDREGTPNVVLEAMASGLPIIATRVGGLPALVRHNESGYLVDRDDDGGLADAILDLVENRERRITFGKHARAFVQQHHARPHLAIALRGLYDAVFSANQLQRPGKGRTPGWREPSSRSME